jgi:hypothetical protein
MLTGSTADIPAEDRRKPVGGIRSGWRVTRLGNKVRNKIGIMRGIGRNAGRRIWVGVKVRTESSK